ncbi:hypothetical protein NB311A_10168 [Nitrobacter sp. Nb-311A]|nr:hypothetical protein NB311A_10168 [Nitrobacter sp. Nb-311A]
MHHKAVSGGLFFFNPVRLPAKLLHGSKGFALGDDILGLGQFSTPSEFAETIGAAIETTPNMLSNPRGEE